jgi:ATP-dependent helicase/nuclease subunit A
MAILFQSLSHVNLYEAVFKTLNIPFVTVAGRGYYSRQEVWDLLNLLQAVYNPSDNLSLASALRSPLFGFSDDALFALRLQRSDDDQRLMSLWDALDQPGGLVPVDEYEKVDFARDCLYDLRASAGRVTISELLRMALERTGYLATLTGLPDGMRRRGNIEKLLEKAESSRKVTLGAFSQYLRDLSARETREGDAPIDATGAINIMTVHASKGLEFPVVVLADASWERRGGQRSPVIVDANWGLACTVYDEEADKQVAPFIYQHIQRVEGLRDDAERLRLLYVGATRAQDLLIISGQVQQKDDSWQSSGWLDHILNALELRETLNPCDDVTIDYEWGQARVSLPRLAPHDDELTHFSEQLSGDWNLTDIDVQPLKPPLLYSVETRPEARLRHLSATHIADIGSVEWAEDYEEEAYYRDRFIREALQDAPTRVESVLDRSRRGASARQIGEIVHEALRYWRLPGNFDADDLRDLLKSYAWKRGIAEGHFVEDAASRAFTLLKLFEQSPVYREIESARNTFRELPFVYQKDGYIVHGVIDLLYQKSDGHWAVMDYKTSFVQGVGGAAKQPDIVLHARRYHLQVGIYAEAASAQLHGETPETYVHYIRHNQTVQINEEEWRGALSQKNLRNRIVQVIEGRM